MLRRRCVSPGADHHLGPPSATGHCAKQTSSSFSAEGDDDPVEHGSGFTRNGPPGVVDPTPYTRSVSIICTACGESNPETAKFCIACGSPVSAVCPSCGTAVVAGASFCQSCGTRLAEVPSEADVAATEERKIVSAMFCDLAGFTAHTERSDPEDVRARLEAFHARVRQDVERFGGRVEKLLGDGVFSVFGVPTAHEDDPERAVRAALRIQESMSEMNETDPELSLDVRIAVTTGEAIVQLSERADREGIIGDVVNSASRLEAVAAPGTVVVDERTYLASRQAIDFVPLPSVTVKGKVEPVAIWKAEDARSRYGVAIDEEPDTPFVGRSEELTLLVDAFDRTVARSTPQVVTVVGEPGVGKSRLVREFRLSLDDRPGLAFWRQGRCLPYGEGIAFWAIGEIVKSHAGILETEPPEGAIAKLEDAVSALVGDADEAQWIASRLRPLVGAASQSSDRSELFAAWTRFFEALASAYPLVLLIEDLHWADDPVVEFLDHLIEWATDSPILLVATARPELFADRPDWTSGRRDAVTVGLDPLSREDAATLMSALGDRPVMPAGIHAALLDRSGGNPLYMTEYMRLAVEQDWFSQAERGEDLPLPDSIHSIIGARIDLLPPDDKALLQAAAVVGRVFWTAALTFADMGPAAEVREGLRRLIRREMIRPVRRSSMEGQDEYTFAHVLIRDVAYGRLTRSERARLHGSTARWLEAVSGDRSGDVAELIAHHLATSYELSPGEDTEMEKRIYRFLMLAVERAMALDADAARAFARRAIDLASDDRERGRALTEWATVTFDDNEAAVDAYEEAIECFRRAGDRDAQVDALTRLGRLTWYLGNADATDAVADRLTELIDGMPASRNVARAIAALASTLQLRGHEAESLDRVEQALRVAQEVGDTDTYARALGVKGGARIQLGDNAGIEEIEEALRIQLDRNRVREAMATYNSLATYARYSGDYERGIEIIEEAIAYGSQRGMTATVDWSHLTLNESLFPTGRWDRLDQVITTFHEAERIRGTQIESGMRGWRTSVLHFRGQSAEALSELRLVLESTRSTKDPQGMMPTLALGVAITEAAGDRDAAEAIADELVSFGTEHPIFLADELPVAARSMIEIGRIDDLRRLADLAISEADRIHDPSARPEDTPWVRIKLDLAVAAVAAEAGRHTEALELLEKLVEEADRRGARLWSTIARIDAARSAAALDLDDRVDELLTVAESDARAMAAGLLLREIDDIRDEDAAATGA